MVRLIFVKLILSRSDVLGETQAPSKFERAMSRNEDPEMAIVIGIYSAERPDMGFIKGGGICIYIYVCMYIYI